MIALGYRGLVLILIVMVLFLPEARAAEKRAQSSAEEIKMGALDYENFCAACHGKNARGNGPVAMELKTAPPSLRKLAAR